MDTQRCADFLIKTEKIESDELQTQMDDDGVTWIQRDETNSVSR